MPQPSSAGRRVDVQARVTDVLSRIPACTDRIVVQRTDQKGARVRETLHDLAPVAAPGTETCVPTKSSSSMWRSSAETSIFTHAPKPSAKNRVAPSVRSFSPSRPIPSPPPAEMPTK